MLVLVVAGTCAQASAATLSLQSIVIDTDYPVEARLYTPLEFPEIPETVLASGPVTAEVVTTEVSPAAAAALKPSPAPEHRVPEPPTGIMSLTTGLGLITAVTIRRRIMTERRTRSRRRVRKLIRLMA